MAPVITSQPAAQATTVGGSATFSVAANGTAPLNFDWALNGAPLPASGTFTIGNCTASVGYINGGATVTLFGVTAGCQGAVIAVNVNNGVNPSAVSNGVTLTVNQAVTLRRMLRGPEQLVLRQPVAPGRRLDRLGLRRVHVHASQQWVSQARRCAPATVAPPGRWPSRPGAPTSPTWRVRRQAYWWLQAYPPWARARTQACSPAPMADGPGRGGWTPGSRGIRRHEAGLRQRVGGCRCRLPGSMAHRGRRVELGPGGKRARRRLRRVQPDRRCRMGQRQRRADLRQRRQDPAIRQPGRDLDRCQPRRLLRQLARHGVQPCRIRRRGGPERARWRAAPTAVPKWQGVATPMSEPAPQSRSQTPTPSLSWATSRRRCAAPTAVRTGRPDLVRRQQPVSTPLRQPHPRPRGQPHQRPHAAHQGPRRDMDADRRRHDRRKRDRHGRIAQRQRGAGGVSRRATCCAARTAERRGRAPAFPVWLQFQKPSFPPSNAPSQSGRRDRSPCPSMPARHGASPTTTGLARSA